MTGPIWMAIAFVATLAIGVPIPFAAGVATLIGLLLIDIPLTLLAQSAYNAFEPFPLTTIPLFTLAGVLMERGGMSKDLIEISRKLFGTLKGGLGLVTVAACMFFAALSGSSPATTAAIGSITIPGMLKEGYKPSFAAAVSASAGALGSMIPPSNLFIIYALVADESIPRLFLAGLVPGLFIGTLLLVTSYIIARRNNYGIAGEAFSLRPLLSAMWQGKWALGVPVVILGGIYTGIFTPSEAAAVAVFYGLFTGVFIYKKLTFRLVYESCRFTAIIIGTVLFILSSAKAFGQLVTLYDIPESVTYLFGPFLQYPWLVLIVIGAFYMIIGMWVESIPQIIVFTGVFLPVVKSLGVDPILFGVLTVLTAEIGFLTPPVGVNLFVASKISKAKIEEVSIGVLPFLFAYVIVYVVMVFVPEVALYLPNLFYGVRLF